MPSISFIPTQNDSTPWLFQVEYDKDYIWSLVHSQLREGGLSQAASDLVMSYFEERYAYALEHIRFARTAEAIAEYVFNGVLSEWTKQLR
ncbi:IFN-response binding factor 1 [Streptococcus pyogenes]|nr:IFN-response binding factor 1 [Streptococcus pyogenes]VGS49216.1 IFN-response binding factor 1 [Streptococcus pyogenes]VGS57972.1 IFN-response binding factor 1 [Streptococcus pyogenes]VGS95724.1 IFN-response binding factor 1 [Streptococcus pyogenes]VGU36588.1 IFN-response binding factor 1 [Streptococcus pyogenes]